MQRPSSMLKIVVKLRAWAGRAAARLGRAKLWALGVFVGALAAYATLVLRLAIDSVSYVFFGAGETGLVGAASEMSFGRVWAVPVAGGVIVALLLFGARRLGWLDSRRPHGVADVIEARAVDGRHVSFRTGLASSLITAVSLGAGASAGREGPAVHLGASIASFVSRQTGLRTVDMRTLLGCGAAAAVAASFNAPIAGVLFALEVVLGNYALSIIGPVTVASVTGALIARFHLGDFPAFAIPDYGVAGVIDTPIALALGIICGLVAAGFMSAAAAAGRIADRTAERLHTPYECLPIIGGVVVGAIGAFAPEILSVGYEATDAALQNALPLGALVAFLVLKAVATAVTLACRFGGGVFSPGLYLGAMAGAAFGIVLQNIAPLETASPSFYAIVGMGAAGGAILGAPISTTLIVFELTGDYQMTMSLLVAVAAATLIAEATFGKSFFHAQLAGRGYDLSDGPQGVILQTIRVHDVMTALPESEERLPEEAERLFQDQTLGQALARMEKAEADGLPVVDRSEPDLQLGYISQYKALKAYNRALVDSHVEHHR
ncbi:MAG: chloride channel protein [Pseudomonadota bacterium]